MIPGWCWCIQERQLRERLSQPARQQGRGVRAELTRQLLTTNQRELVAVVQAKQYLQVQVLDVKDQSTDVAKIKWRGKSSTNSSDEWHLSPITSNTAKGSISTTFRCKLQMCLRTEFCAKAAFQFHWHNSDTPIVQRTRSYVMLLLLTYVSKIIANLKAQKQPIGFFWNWLKAVARSWISKFVNLIKKISNFMNILHTKREKAFYPVRRMFFSAAENCFTDRQKWIHYHEELHFVFEHRTKNWQNIMCEK